MERLPEFFIPAHAVTISVLAAVLLLVFVRLAAGRKWIADRGVRGGVLVMATGFGFVLGGTLFGLINPPAPRSWLFLHTTRFLSREIELGGFLMVLGLLAAGGSVLRENGRFPAASFLRRNK